MKKKKSKRNTNRKKKSKRNKIKTIVQKAFFANLPQDLINDILLRLPVKTLVSCRYVCKLWLYLISNPIFINTHLQKSNLSSNCLDRKLIVSVSRYSDDVQLYFIKSLSLDNESNVVVLDYPTRDCVHCVTIVGSCNGLVCIHFDKVGIFIWNPCTRISKKLPLSSLKSMRADKLANYGFGYDPFSDDYKVVLMVYVDGSNFSDFEPKRAVEVYSLKSNSWRKTRDLHRCGNSFVPTGQYVNGVLHWALVHLRSDEFKPVIVSFDLENGTLGEIEQPCYGEGCHSYMGLGVLEGCLSIFCHFKNPEVKFCTEVWVMKEHGVKNTWIKLYTIPYTAKHIDVFPAFYSPLYISMTGEILLDDRGRLVLYNPNNGTFRILNFSDGFGPGQTLAYVESLVSPNIYEEMSITQH